MINQKVMTKANAKARDSVALTIGHMFLQSEELKAREEALIELVSKYADKYGDIEEELK